MIALALVATVAVLVGLGSKPMWIVLNVASLAVFWAGALRFRHDMKDS